MKIGFTIPSLPSLVVFTAILILGASACFGQPIPPSLTQITSNRLQSLVNQYGTGKLSLAAVSNGVANIAQEQAVGTNTNAAPPITNLVLKVQMVKGQTVLLLHHEES